jgi:hypothetical protein
MCFECVILCEVACDHQTVSGLPITLCVYMTYDHEPLGQAFVKVGYAVFCDCETMWVLITFGADCVLSCVMPAVGLSVHDISYPCCLSGFLVQMGVFNAPHYFPKFSASSPGGPKEVL